MAGMLLFYPCFYSFLPISPPFFFVCYPLFPCLLHVSTIVHLLFTYCLTIVIIIDEQFLNNKFHIFVSSNEQAYTGEWNDRRGAWEENKKGMGKVREGIESRFDRDKKAMSNKK